MSKASYLNILTVSALYPPHIIGGAEIIAAAIDLGLRQAGNPVFVLSTTTEVGAGHDSVTTIDAGIELNRVAMPRPYTALNYAAHPAWKKLIWHAQDHFDPRNESLWAANIDRIKPDVALVHVAQGLGYNGLRVLADRDIPTIVVLHDQSLTCIKRSMFSKGQTCVRQCGSCRLSSQVKMAYLSRIPRLGFVSPSEANLSRLKSYLPISDYPATVIYNPASYPVPQTQPINDGTFRLLYVGQISEQKGVEFLIEIVASLAEQHRVELTLIGDGPLRSRLETRFGHNAWLKFTGQVSLQTVSDHMAQSDILCTPSLWFENLPGVIIQALSLGLPVLASDIGGIPELITHNVNGQLLPPGDAEAWSHSLTALIEKPAALAKWSENAVSAKERFSAKRATDHYLRFIRTIISAHP